MGAPAQTGTHRAKQQRTKQFQAMLATAKSPEERRSLLTQEWLRTDGKGPFTLADVRNIFYSPAGNVQTQGRTTPWTVTDFQNLLLDQLGPDLSSIVGGSDYRDEATGKNTRRLMDAVFEKAAMLQQEQDALLQKYPDSNDPRRILEIKPEHIDTFQEIVPTYDPTRTAQRDAIRGAIPKAIVAAAVGAGIGSLLSGAGAAGAAGTGATGATGAGAGAGAGAAGGTATGVGSTLTTLPSGLLELAVTAAPATSGVGGAIAGGAAGGLIGAGTAGGPIGQPYPGQTGGQAPGPGDVVDGVRVVGPEDIYVEPPVLPPIAEGGFSFPDWLKNILNPPGPGGTPTPTPEPPPSTETGGTTSGPSTRPDGKVYNPETDTWEDPPVKEGPTIPWLDLAQTATSSGVGGNLNPMNAPIVQTGPTGTRQAGLPYDPKQYKIGQILAAAQLAPTQRLANVGSFLTDEQLGQGLNTWQR